MISTRKNLQRSANRWATDYLYKYGIEYPTCQFPKCNKKAEQKYIPNPSKDTRHYINFFCKDHFQKIINPKQGYLTEDEQNDETLTAEQKHQIKTSRERQNLLNELPDPFNIKEMPKTKSQGKSKTAVRREIRAMLSGELSYIKKDYCEFPECEYTAVDKDVTYYMRPDGSIYNVSFLCRSCRGKANYDKTILQRTPSYELKQIILESENNKEYILEEGVKETTMFLKERLKKECAIRGVYPTNECCCCLSEIPKEKLLTSPKIDAVFPDGLNHLKVAFFCEDCSEMSDQHSYDLFYEYKYPAQDIAQFAPAQSSLRHYLEYKENIESAHT